MRKISIFICLLTLLSLLSIPASACDDTTQNHTEIIVPLSPACPLPSHDYRIVDNYIDHVVKYHSAKVPVFDDNGVITGYLDVSHDDVYTYSVFKYQCSECSAGYTKKSLIDKDCPIN